MGKKCNYCLHRCNCTLLKIRKKEGLLDEYFMCKFWDFDDSIVNDSVDSSAITTHPIKNR